MYPWQQTCTYCLLYAISLKLELVCHLVFNSRHEIFTSVRKRVFHFGIALSGVEQCDDKAKVFALLVKISCLLNARWQTSSNLGCIIAICACLLPWIPNLLVLNCIKSHRLTKWPSTLIMLSHNFVSTVQSTLKQKMVILKRCFRGILETPASM